MNANRTDVQLKAVVSRFGNCTGLKTLPVAGRRPATTETGLDRADGEIDYVFHLHGFFLQEGFAILYADQGASVAGQEIHSGVEFVDGQENTLFAFAFGGTKLRAIGEDGPAAGAILFCDVHDESWRHAFE
jgi:hypothetical protein